MLQDSARHTQTQWIPKKAGQTKPKYSWLRYSPSPSDMPNSASPIWWTWPCLWKQKHKILKMLKRKSCFFKGLELWKTFGEWLNVIKLWEIACDMIVCVLSKDFNLDLLMGALPLNPSPCCNREHDRGAPSDPSSGSAPNSTF